MRWLVSVTTRRNAISANLDQSFVTLSVVRHIDEFRRDITILADISVR
jgi:hypothetical protein